MTATRSVLLAALMIVATVVPAVGAVAATGTLSVGVSQADDGTATVTVTDNGTAVENATVEVVAVNNTSYVGEGTQVTDANGTVSLPAPSENVTISVTATDGNRTASTTATLAAADGGTTDEAFGRMVVEFVHWLQENREEFTPGAVAEFVLEYNPGNAPDHAGPKDDPGASGNQTAGNETGAQGQGPGENGNGNGNGKAKGHGGDQ